jgi:hypothetical protein
MVDPTGLDEETGEDGQFGEDGSGGGGGGGGGYSGGGDDSGGGYSSSGAPSSYPDSGWGGVGGNDNGNGNYGDTVGGNGYGYGVGGIDSVAYAGSIFQWLLNLIQMPPAPTGPLTPNQQDTCNKLNQYQADVNMMGTWGAPMFPQNAAILQKLQAIYCKPFQP